MVLVMVVVVAGRDDEATPPTTTIPVGGTLRIGVVGPAVATDPALLVATDAGSAMVDDLLWSRLTATDPTTAAPVPSLAESWEASADLTRFTFRLRPDAVFSDGSPITATDVAASLTRVAALGAASLASGPLSTVQGYAEAPSGGLSGSPPPTPPPSRSSSPSRSPTCPPSSPLPPTAWCRPRSPAASVRPCPARRAGPTRWRPRTPAGMRLQRAPATPSDRPSRPRRDQPVRHRGRRGRCVRRRCPRPGALGRRSDRRTWSRPASAWCGSSPAAAVWWIAADTTDPTLSSVELRRGIAHAADRAAIVVTSLPGRRLLDGVVPPQVPGGTDGACGPPARSTRPRRRRRWPWPSPQERRPSYSTGRTPRGRPGPSPPSPRPSSTAGLPRPRAAGRWPTTGPQVLSPDKQLFWFGWVGLAPTPEAYLPALFLSGSPDDVTGLSDPAVDAAIRAARATADPEARAGPVGRSRAAGARSHAGRPARPGPERGGPVGLGAGVRATARRHVRHRPALARRSLRRRAGRRHRVDDQRPGARVAGRCPSPARPRPPSVSTGSRSCERAAACSTTSPGRWPRRSAGSCSAATARASRRC